MQKMRNFEPYENFLLYGMLRCIFECGLIVKDLIILPYSEWWNLEDQLDAFLCQLLLNFPFG